MASANLPSTPPPPSSPPSISASHAESSATVATALVPPQPQPQPQVQLDAATNENGTFNVLELKPQMADHFAILDDPEHIQKYKKYEADYTSRLLAKYFSKKNFYGGNIFDEKTRIDSETIMSSRWPCTRSFADPVHAFEDPSNGGPVSEPETLPNISNGKPPLKKNG